MTIPSRRGEPKIVNADEEIFNTKIEKIPTLRSAFQKDGIFDIW